MELKARDVLTVILIALLTAAGILIACLKAPAQVVPANILNVARAEIGHGEIIFDNRGPDVRRFLNGRENLPWCAGFVSYCARRSGYNTPYTLRAKDYLAMGKRVSNPAPGDIAVFTRQGGGHVGIVESVSADRIVTIEGNVGQAPAKVKRMTYQRGNMRNLTAFIRLGVR